MAKRREHLKPPAYLSKSPPVPRPDTAEAAKEHGGREGKDPTRYGDWEKKGIAIDF